MPSGLHIFCLKLKLIWLRLEIAQYQKFSNILSPILNKKLFQNSVYIWELFRLIKVLGPGVIESLRCSDGFYHHLHHHRHRRSAVGRGV